MKTLGIIPARYASSRLEGKPLAMIAGKTMIEHVYQRSLHAVDELMVATDDKRIVKAVEDFGGKVVMTSAEHRTGTNRCLEAFNTFEKNGGQADVVLNIQGDEPMIDAEEIIRLAALFRDSDTQLGTLVKAVETQDELDNNTGCFVVINKNQEALYFSRTLIPFVQKYPREEWLGKHTFYKHLGMYGYRPEALQKFAQMEQSALEIAESLEQNRWLENGGKIKVGFAEKESLSVDTAEDLQAVRLRMEKQ